MPTPAASSSTNGESGILRSEERENGFQQQRLNDPFEFSTRPRYTNAFLPLTEYSTYEKIKVFFFTITLIAPLRIFIIVFLMRIGMRWIMFLAGFYWVHVEGSYDPKGQDHHQHSSLNLGHHLSHDIHRLLRGCKGRSFQSPNDGKLPEVSQRNAYRSPVPRSPECGEEEYESSSPRCEPSILPQRIALLGNNGRQLSAFKEGAFDCGVPIQPVGLEYPARFNDIFALKNMAWVFYWSCCQFVNFHTVRFMPVYTPTEAEIEDPALYARNVRTLMCTSLHRQPVPYVFEDELLRIVCRDNFMRVHQHRIMMKQVYEEFGVSMHYVDHWVKMLHGLDSDGDGLLSIEDVLSKLSLSDDSKEADAFKRIWPALKVDESADPKLEDIPAPYDKPLREEGSWYDSLSGGIPPVPSRPLDEIPTELLAIHDIIPAFVVIFSLKEEAVEKRREGLNNLFRAVFATSPEDFTTDELREQLREKLQEYMPTIASPPQRHGYENGEGTNNRKD
ncbi:Lysophosphatidylcholine acyltransferase 2 [Perkinsus olseni]|uniref:Lysophosphatidylcholine acyltransferase 2 n=1 Tax=Perkinsus olseni TaxID=32597 RepID=A0A7J6PLI2_PEROL|nr:Lysophosphatidylcholine acyltransferase 2 [Perkinsus olseni]